MSQTAEKHHGEGGKKEAARKAWGFLPTDGQHTGKCHMTGRRKLQGESNPQHLSVATQQRSNADKPTSPRLRAQTVTGATECRGMAIVAPGRY